MISSLQELIDLSTNYLGEVVKNYDNPMLSNDFYAKKESLKNALTDLLEKLKDKERYYE